MADTSTFQTSQQPSALTHRLTRALHSAWSAYWAYKTAQASVVILRSLDDRTLKDIGMDRSEIESVAHNIGRDRRVVLQASAIEHRPRPSMCA
jgi:uncharacterized protein YjiS (DUF1127 family)